MRVLSDADARFAHHLVLENGMMRLVVIAAHQNNPVQLAAAADSAANADNRVADVRMVDNAAVRDNSVIYLRAINLRSRQEARAAEDRRAHVEEIETGQLRGAIEIGIKERTDGSDVLPIALKNVRINAQVRNSGRNDVFPEISE